MQQIALLREDGDVMPLAPRPQAWNAEPLAAFQQWLRNQVHAPRPPRGAAPRAPRPYSRSSQATYVSLFARYLAHLRSIDATLPHAAPSHVDLFLQGLTGRQNGLAAHETKRRALVLLERVYRELMRLRLAHDNPTKPLFRQYATPPASRAATTVLGAEQLAALCEHIRSLPAETFDQARRGAMLAVMLSCGITGEELRTLALAVVRQDAGLCIEMPKTATHDRGRLHLGATTAPILERYLQLREQAQVAGPLLFPATPAGTAPISHQTLHRHVTCALDAAGVRDRVGAQRILRATLAVKLLEAQVSREDVRKTLRLYQLDQVERYERFKRVLPPY